MEDSIRMEIWHTVILVERGEEKLMQSKINLPLFTLIIIYSYSPHCFLDIYYDTDKENLFDTPELLKLFIISFFDIPISRSAPPELSLDTRLIVLKLLSRWTMPVKDRELGVKGGWGTNNSG